MSQDLVLHLPGAALDADTRLSWLLCDSQQRVLSQGESALSEVVRDALQGVAPQSARTRVSVLVPGEQVLLTEARIPSRQRSQIKKALPYMVEEQVADAIETVHLAIPEQLDGSGAVPVAVVRHQLLIEWLDLLCQHALRPERLVPDSLCVPWSPHQYSLLLGSGRWLWRERLHSAQALAPSHWPLLAEQLATSAEEGARLRVIVTADGPDAEEQGELAAAMRERLGIEVECQHYEEPALELLAVTLLSAPQRAINLLQGGYRQSSTASQVSPWRRLGAAVAGLFLAYSAVTLAAAGWFDQRAAQLEREGADLYRELFPQEQRVVSPRRQMSSHLQRLGSGEGELFELLGRSAPLLQTTQEEPVLVEQVRYRGGHGELQIDVRSDSVEGLEQLRQRLSGAGLSVDLGAATERDRSASSRITVKAR